LSHASSPFCSSYFTLSAVPGVTDSGHYTQLCWSRVSLTFLPRLA
jgi:hypothetical protein